MKKILSLVLILALSLCLFAGCDKQPATTGAAEGNGLEDAATYLYAMYKDNDGSLVRRDFKRVAVVMIDNVKYDITWTADSAEVTIGAVENSQVTININEEPAEDVTFKLTATIKDKDGNTKTVTFTHYIEAPKASGTVFVKTPEVGTAYKFALEQNELGQTLYFTGEMSGYYLAMSTNPFDAVDVFVEDVDGGQRIYFMKGEVKTYIDIVPRGADQPGKVNVILTETPAAVFTWDAERKTYTAKVEENTWYLGTYSTYNTISASNVTYIEDVSKIGDSQFPAGFCTVTITPSQVKAPAVNTAYKFALVQNEIGQTLYFTGAMSGYYLAMSQNPGEGVNVFIEDVDGGQRIYFMKGETKTYIDIVPRGADQPGKVNVILTETPAAVFTWDAERLTYTAKVEENTWYLGTYSTYNTISASNVSYIEDVSKIGDSQFPAGPYIVDGFMEMQPDFSQPEEKPEDKPEDKPVTPDVPTGDTLTIEQAIALGAAQEHNVYTEAKYYVTGVITEIYNETYGNMYITDGAGNTLCIYGTYDADGTNRFDAMATKPVVGDTVTIYGVIGQYNGTPQIKNGWIVKIGAEETGNTLTIEQAIAMGAAQEHNVYTEEKYYVTGVITEVYNTTYGNMYITDGAGNTLCIYGTYDADGTNRYDAMATKPVAGDTVTIYGVIGQYNGTPQIKNGWITAHTPAASQPETPENPSTSDVELTAGMKIVIYIPAEGKALSSVATGNNLSGVDVTLTDGVLTGFGTTEIWTVVVNADGTFSFEQNGVKLGMQDSYASMSMGSVNDTWEVISLGDGLYNIKNVVRGNFMDWYQGKFSTYNSSSAATDPAFQIAFFIVE